MTAIHMYRSEDSQGEVSLRFVVTQTTLVDLVEVSTDHEVTHAVSDYLSGEQIRRAVLTWAKPYGGDEIQKA